MSRLFSLILILVLTSSCDKNKIIYVAGTLDNCEDNPSQKCLQVKENKEDDWTIIANSIEGFEHKEGYLQKIEVTISKIKDPKLNESAFNYKFVKLVYEEQNVLEAPFSSILDKNHAGKWQVNSMAGIDSLTKQPIMIFKDGKVSGNAGCNKYGAVFTLNGNEITFGLAMATKMYCPNMPIEKTYFDCLTKVKTYKLVGNELTFYDKDTIELMQCTLLEEE